MADLPDLDKTRYRFQCAYQIVDQLRFLVGIHQAVKIARLVVIVATYTVVVAVGIATYF